MMRTVCKPLVALLLVVAAVVCVAELSGKWDQTLPDANDEAGLVAVVLCVGAALSVAARAAQIARPRRQGARPLTITTVARPAGRAPADVPFATISPPTPRRV